MKQQEFLEKFHPNYDEISKKIGDIKLILATKFNTYAEIVGYNKQIQYLLDKAFEEALQNFINKICGKQKEICTNNLDVFFRIQGIITYESIKEVVSSSTTPKIEDL